MKAGKFDLKTFVRRTKLYVPANREKFVAKAWTRGADCIILDLEDDVANMKYVNYLFIRAEAVEKRNAEKAAALAAAGHTA